MNLKSENEAMAMALYNLCERNNISPDNMIKTMRQADREFKKNIEKLKKKVR